MRTLPLTVQPTCRGPQSQKGILLQLILNQCTEGNRGHVWLCFMILGVLCRCSWAYGSTAEDLQSCLNNLKQFIEKSDAMLYTPSIDEIKENCDSWSLMCYLLELEMVLIEEQIEDNNANCISAFKEEHENNTKDNAETCPPCEAMPLKNSTIFLANLKSLLNKLTVQWKRDKM